jgi:hypothetical protein
MDKLKQKFKTRPKQLKGLPKDKIALLKGTLIATFISATPYLFYLHESVPSEKTWDTFLFTYESTYFQDVNTVMWLLSGKVIPIALLFVWFFTCRHWWYHALLVPIVMYIIQIVGLLNDDFKYYDEFQYEYFIPIMAIIIPSIYLIRARMFDKLNNADKTMQELEEEFMIKPTTFWGKIKQYF